MPQLSPSSGLMIFIFSVLTLTLVVVTLTSKLPWKLMEPSTSKSSINLVSLKNTRPATKKVYL